MSNGIVRKNAGSGHSYQVDGVKVAGVTTVIGQTLAKPALMHWAARSVAEFVANSTNGELDVYRQLGYQGMVNALKSIPFNDRNAKADRGKRAHVICEALITGQEVEIPDDLFDYALGAKMFMDEWQPRLVLAETTVASRRWMYAGTFDLIADIRNGERVLFDYKTTRDVYPETALQLAAYRWAEWYVGSDGTEMPMEELGVDCCKAVRIFERGYQVVPLDTTPEVFAVFRHLRSVYGAGPEHMKDWVGLAQEAPRRPVVQL